MPFALTLRLLPFAPQPQMGRYFATFWVANDFYQSLAGPDGRML
jgi:hypothetical protein